MTVSYHKRCDGSLVPDYMCQRDGINTGTPPCQNICGSGIDAAVGGLVLDALTPLAIQAALQGRRPAARPGRAGRRAARHPRAAGPRTPPTPPAAATWPSTPPTGWSPTALEADWNARLRDLADAEKDYQRAREQAASHCTDTQLAQVRALAGRPARPVGTTPPASMKDRKRLIGCSSPTSPCSKTATRSPRMSGCPAGSTAP